MRVLGYTYSDGSVLCAEHATDTTDGGNETGQAFGIYNWHEAHSDVVCDVEGCGVILASNCVDGCELQEGNRVRDIGGSLHFGAASTITNTNGAESGYTDGWERFGVTWDGEEGEDWILAEYLEKL